MKLMSHYMKVSYNGPRERPDLGLERGMTRPRERPDLGLERGLTITFYHFLFSSFSHHTVGRNTKQITYLDKKIV